jgi:putative SOS response-associated peptidase YedK
MTNKAHVRPLHQPTDLARDGRTLSAGRARTTRTQFTRALQHLPHRYGRHHIERGGKRDLAPMRWGLIPSWWKKRAKEIPATFNARAETLADRPMFRDAFRRNRCLIPASGYYEWLATSTGKQPYYYTGRDDSPLTFAGLWDEWKDRETGTPLRSCTMVVTTARRPGADRAGCRVMSAFRGKAYIAIALHMSAFDPKRTG